MEFTNLQTVTVYMTDCVTLIRVSERPTCHVVLCCDRLVVTFTPSALLDVRGIETLPLCTNFQCEVIQ